MKKVFLVLALAFTCFLANASNNKTTTTQTAAPKKSIEWQSNMILVDQKDSVQKAKGGCEYLGVYDVYINGQYVGTFDVFIC